MTIPRGTVVTRRYTQNPSMSDMAMVQQLTRASSFLAGRGKG
jgi:hypothetical protein